MIFLFVLSAFDIIHAQQDVPEKFLEVRGISELEMEPLARATATLFEGTNKVKSVQTGSDGSFSFRLDINKQYTIEVEKDGLISKRISFNTQMPDEEKGTWMNEFSIGLVKPCAGIDYSILRQPVDRVSFDAKRREYVSDKDYVNSMRTKIEALMIKTDQCLLQTYEDLVKKADQAARQNNPQEAVKYYQEALKIYPSEDYPSKKIAEINNSVEKQQVSAEAYKAIIAEADALSSQGRMSEALQKYEKAGTLNPAEAYPRQKAAEIKTALAEQQALKEAQQLKDDKFNQAMAKASVAYTRKDFAVAKQYYQEALEIKPAESLPKSRVQEIESIESKKAAEVASKAAEAAKKAAFDKEYQGVVAQADELFKAKKYDEAKAVYARAMTMKPAESYPAQRVKVIENAEATEQATIQKTKEDNYNTAMAAANNAIARNQFELARESYNKALTFKPDDIQAKKGISETDRLAGEFARQKSLGEQYNQSIATADAMLAQKKWTEAKDSYNKALSVKPGDKYAQTKITYIENTLSAEEAARIKATEETYKTAIASANKAVIQKMYGEAKELLQKALSAKPGDNYAMVKMAEIDRLVLEQKKLSEQEQNLARQYQDLINSGDNLFNDREFANARVSYTKALQLKPGDTYASQKISAIDNLQAAESAAKQKQTENAYSEAMSRGNVSLTARNYKAAREAFQQALSTKPGDNNAKMKLSEVDLIEKQDQEKLLAEQNRKKKYNDAISLADQHFAQKNFLSAKTYYEQALDLIPGEAYPRLRLDESIKAIEDQDRLLTEKKARENAYTIALANADKYFKAKEYNQAKDEYGRALTIKPEETFPKTRIVEIENLIAVREKEQMEAKARTDAYTAAISAGNGAFERKDYNPARESYTLALKHRPGDLLATDQIKKIDYLLAEAEKIRKNEDAKRTAFQSLIQSADKSFDEARYADAKDNYKKALILDPTSAYAKQRVSRIDEINRLLTQTPAKTNQQSVQTAPKVIAAIPMGELNFRNDSERQLYLNELVKKYPSGITLEKYKEKYKETFRYIVIRNNEAQEFRHIWFTSYNGAQYSVNGKPITQQYFNSQIRVREGESYKEIVMQ